MRLEIRSLFVLLILGFTSTAFAATWYVQPDAPPGGDGTSWQQAFDTIQEGIDAASEGDTVLLGDGTYTGYGNRDISFEGKGITVKSLNGPKHCIVDVQATEGDYHCGFKFVNQEPASAVLVGVTVQNAFVLWSGGGIYVEQASPTVMNCIIRNNQSVVAGSGIGVQGNYSICNPTFVNCLIHSNHSPEAGAGLHVAMGSHVTLVNCTIADNDIDHTVLTNGAAIWADIVGYANLKNCLIWSNMSGIGSQIDYGSNSLIETESSIVHQGWIETQSPAVHPLTPVFGSEYSLNAVHQLIDSGDETSLPLDVADLDNDGDFQETIPVDLYGAPRSVNQRVDIGAIEYQHDCDSNGIPDFVDIANCSGDVGCADCNTNGLLDVCELADGVLDDCNGNSIPDTCDIASGTSQDADDNGVPDECRMTWHVSADAAPGGNGTSWETAFQTIQEGVDQAHHGDEIIVADGVYTGPGNRDIRLFGKRIKVRSANGPGNCLIACSGAPTGFDLTDYETRETVISGFAIQGATGKRYKTSATNTDLKGGAFSLYSSGPSITNCILWDNTADSGAAVFACSSTALLSDCRIHSNFSQGAVSILNSKLDVRKCRFEKNKSDSYAAGVLYGNGIVREFGRTQITDCDFFYNTSEVSSGAVFLYWDHIDILNSCFVGNSGSSHGAVRMYGTASVANSVFIGNQATAAEGTGGAVYIHSGMPSITNCTFIDNFANKGGGLYCRYSKPMISNSILWNNTADDSPQIYTESSTPQVNHSNVEGGWVGTHNINADPGFLQMPSSGADGQWVDNPATPQDETLDNDPGILIFAPLSTCIDRGSNELLPVDVHDLDSDGDTLEPIPFDSVGANRIVNEIVDMGTIEFTDDCNNNGIPDSQDVQDCQGELWCQDCNFNLLPDTCDIAYGQNQDCNENLIPDQCDVETGFSTDCDVNGYPDECELAGNDCNANGIHDQCDLQDMTSTDCNSSGIPDECELDGNDCNENGIHDQCDVQDLTSSDCDSSGIPDECELDDNDCNTNGEHDACDIEKGISQDENGDGRPDECKTTWYVSADAPSGGDGTSWETAFSTIQDGINAAFESDRVLVGDGIYREDGNHSLHCRGLRFVLESLNGPGSCIIEVNNEYDVGFYLIGGETPDTVIRGFTVRNTNTGSLQSSNDSGGMICISSSPTVENCIFSNCRGSNGGAAHIDRSSPVFINCAFLHCEGTNGGAINCLGASIRLVGCLLADNRANDGGAIYSRQSNCTIANCSIVNNTAAWNGAALHSYYNSHVSMINSIIWDNVGRYESALYSENNSTLSVSHCFVDEEIPGDANQNADPRFVFVGSDYHLLPDSPCIDQGVATPEIPIPASDLDGAPRVVGEAMDVGSYEHQQQAATCIAVSKNDIRMIAYGGEVPKPASLSIRNSGVGQLNWSLASDQPWLMATPTSGSIGQQEQAIRLDADPAQLAPGVYSATIQISNLDDPLDVEIISVDLLVGVVLMVNAEGSQQYPTIQDAVYAANDGDLVTCEEGTYSGMGNTEISFQGKAIKLRGKTRTQQCIIECQGDREGPGFLFNNNESRDTIIENFVVQNCRGRDGGGVYCYNASPTIANCTFRNNQAIGNPRPGMPPMWGPGGGIRLTGNSSPIIDRCTIDANSAENGGGISCDSGTMPEISNTIITNNTAEYAGGGLYLESYHSKITNCLIALNQSDYLGGGIYSNEGPLNIVNSIVWANTLEDGTPSQIDVFSEFEVPVSVTYSLIQGGMEGQGNLDADPLLVLQGSGQYRLKPGSPCIDSANNEAIPETSLLDRAGYARRFDDPHTDDTGYGESPIVDMGPFEHQPSRADYDSDGDTDLADFGHFQVCFGSDDAMCIQSFDLDWNETIDLEDYYLLEPIFAGPQVE